MKFRNEELAEERLTTPITLKQLKEDWLRIAQQAEEYIAKLPAEDVGCLYLDVHDLPFAPDPLAPGFAKVTRHRGSVKGSWPKIA